MTATLRKFENFLKRNCTNQELVARSVELLQPIYGKAASGIYNLAPADELDQLEIANTLALAIRRPVPMVTAISAQKLLKQSGWYSQLCGLANSDRWLSMALEDAWGTLADSIFNKITDKICNDDDIQDGEFRNYVAVALRRTFSVSLEDPLMNNIGTTLFYLTDFVVRNDEVNWQKLAPLVRLLPRALPLAEKQGDRFCWLVLTK